MEAENAEVSGDEPESDINDEEDDDNDESVSEFPFDLVFEGIIESSNELSTKFLSPFTLIRGDDDREIC